MDCFTLIEFCGSGPCCPSPPAPANIYWVADEFRKNPRSKIPGGCCLVFLKKDNGKFIGFDKVHNQRDYIMLAKRDFIAVWKFDK